MIKLSSSITLKFPKTDPRKIILNRAANSHPRLTRGIVWCQTCGATRNVKAEKCMAIGWPKCCGTTMTIDSPEEREVAEHLKSEWPELFEGAVSAQKKITEVRAQG